MAEISKPLNLSLTWASGGDVLNPGDTKYATGWQVEIPPRQWFNFLDNRQDEAIAHINQRGVAQWDAQTEYQDTKSYVQGVTGTVYRSKQTSVNQDPDADVGEVYWEIAFASAGDFYTKTEANGLYLARAQNLDDLTNTVTARTNLSVYSKAETYTKTEVDSKTTVASTAQAQSWDSNTTLLTPLKLAEAFKGSNQSLTANGFQKTPGGYIEQWGSQSVPAGVSGTVYNLPITFPGTAHVVVASHLGSSSGAINVEAVAVGTSQVRLTHNSGTTASIAYIVIGS